MEDRILVKRARRGDAAAFTGLVERHERRMYAIACSLLRSEWDAADAVQEAFTEAFDHLDDLRDGDRFKAWLSRIVVNKCHQSYRATSRLVAVEEVPEAPPTEPSGREDALDLARAVRALDDDQRVTVALRYFCDLKLEEVAEIIGCPVGTVKSRLSRALERLQATIGGGAGRAQRADVQEVAR